MLDKKSFVLALVFLLFPILSYSSVYNIGPGQTYSTISDFPGWTSLQPGDHVYIYPGTYHELIFLCQSGTADKPIVIEGVPDKDGTLPVISGDNAIIPPQFDPHLSKFDLGEGKIAQGYGIIFIHRSLQDDPYGWAPEYCQIKNLEIRSATPELYSFTNTKGSVQAYPDSSSGIYVKTGNHILVENCIIHDNGNGISVQGVDVMVHDVTVRGCHIYGNGRTDARYYREHNVYTEASGVVFEYNLIGPLRDGSGGSALKDRSADTVIRYNVVYSGSRILDLVEPENQSSYSCDGSRYTIGRMHDEPGFSDTWVYGNTFINGPAGSAPTSGNMFHYGADNCPSISRKGILHFYHNTVYINLDRTTNYYCRIFDLKTNNETVELYNNAFVSFGTTKLYLGYLAGAFNWFGGNWVTAGYSDLYPGSIGKWNEAVTILGGDNNGLFTNAEEGDFSLPTGSPLLDAAVALPSTIMTAHNVTLEYLPIRGYQTRTDLADIGAFYSDSIAGSDVETPVSGEEKSEGIR